MEGPLRRWPAAASGALLIWIVCCTWAQPSLVGVSPYAKNMTDLQHHVEFFGRNRDGVITIAESIEAFIRIGCDPAFAATYCCHIDSRCFRSFDNPTSLANYGAQISTCPTSMEQSILATLVPTTRKETSSPRSPRIYSSSPSSRRTP